MAAIKRSLRVNACPKARIDNLRTVHFDLHVFLKVDRLILLDWMDSGPPYANCR